ncbi:MAG: hypothetical protein K0U93_22420 [Gammaproteobacteria bacterium]|nr:hypothetical protein [Gammaproteobacteria bacterium]
MTLRKNGEVAAEGSGADVLGDPRIALAWLANSHAHRGCGLQAGDIITTGVCGVPAPIGRGDNLTADFGPLGGVEVGIT